MPFVRHGAARPRGGWAAPLALFLAILFARLVYVSLYGGDTPYWDQWDAEGALLLKPIQDGNWSVWQLLSLHNEHRIAYTRMLAVILFKANTGQWDNLVEAYAGAALGAAVLTFLFTRLRRYSHKASTVAAFVLLAAISALPFPWENILVGFQTHFYFLLFFAVLIIWTAAAHESRPATLAALSLIGLLGLVTSASGVLAVFAVMLVVAGRAYQRRNFTRWDAATLLAMLVVGLIGFHLVPNLPGSETLQAHGIAQHLNAITNGLSWPMETQTAEPLAFSVRLPFALAFWIPSALALLRVFRRAPLSTSAWFALGMSALIFAQLAAIAHSRGADQVHVASRYMDIPAIGLVLNGWLIADLYASAERRGFSRWILASLGLVFAGCAIYAFAIRTPWDMRMMEQRALVTLEETRNVAAYVNSGDPTWLAQPSGDIPYPSPSRLRELLDDPTIVAMLPPSIRRPLDVVGTFAPADGQLLRPLGLPASVRSVFLTRETHEGDATRTSFVSQPLNTRFPYVQVYLEGSRPRHGNMRVWLEGSDGRESALRSSSRQSGSHWRRAFASVPETPFRLRAIDESPERWIAFDEPVEAGRLSAWAARLQDATRRALSSVYEAPPDHWLADNSPVPPPGTQVQGGSCNVDGVNSVGFQRTTIDIATRTLRVEGWAVASPADGLPAARSRSQSPGATVHGRISRRGKCRGRTCWPLSTTRRWATLASKPGSTWAH